MNCFEFRRLYLIDAIANTQQLSHVSHCKQCAKFALSLSRINYKLSSSFEVPMPTHWKQLCQEVQQVLLHRYRFKMYLWVGSMMIMCGAGAAVYYV